MCDVITFSTVRTGEAKTPGRSSDEVNSLLDVMLAIAVELGYSRRPADRVLDFGCGIGETVSALLARGFDAYGVDVGEWWGKDFHAYWHDSPVPPATVHSRLSSTSESDYRLPYPNEHFDLIISSQVFEHVTNYVDVFRELKRVAKPGCVSVHVFPGPGPLPEPHLGIPITWLAKNDVWLATWAFFKREHRRTWKGEYEFLRDSMKHNNYPSRSKLQNYASVAGVGLAFQEQLYIEASKGRPWKLLRIAPFLAPLVRRLCQRTMVITTRP